MKNYLYVITNISMPGICKVGITNNIETRLKSLNGTTSLPTKFQVYEKFEFKNAELLEQKILQHFAHLRVSRKREFLEIHPERVCDFIIDNKNFRVEKEGDLKGLFTRLGIPEGESLKFKEGSEIYQNITARSGAKNYITFDGKKTSLSKSAQKILKEKFEKNWKAVQGTIYWTYKGKTIRELMDEEEL